MQLLVEDRTNRVNTGNRVDSGMIFRHKDTDALIMIVAFTTDNTELYAIDLSDGCLFSTDDLYEYNIGEVQRYLGVTFVDAQKVIVE